MRQDYRTRQRSLTALLLVLTGGGALLLRWLRLIVFPDWPSALKDPVSWIEHGMSGIAMPTLVYLGCSFFVTWGGQLQARQWRGGMNSLQVYVQRYWGAAVQTNPAAYAFGLGLGYIGCSVAWEWQQASAGAGFQSGQTAADFVGVAVWWTHWRWWVGRPTGDLQAR